MKVIACSDAHREAWDDYVRRSSRASFYHLYDWRTINSKELGHGSLYLAAVDNDTIIGVFPIVRVRSWLFGNLACSMPFVNFGGPCGDTDDAEAALIAQASEFVRSERIAYVEMRNRRIVGRGLPTSEHKVSMTVRLNSDPDNLWKAFKTDHRNDVRRAYKRGFRASFGGIDLLDSFYSVISESWHELGTPLYRKRYFRRILAMYPDRCRVCVVFAGDEPAAAAFDGLHGDTIEGMWLGIRAKFRSQMAGYVLYWELLKDACEHGFTHFHLGRSTSDSAAEVYKRKWNAQATQLHWQYILGTRRGVPALNVQNPRYATARRLWRQLPVAFTRWAGPYVARSIP